MTAIRGYKRIGGLPDDPHTDPQDRSWYGPHDRLFTEEEYQEMKFQTGPESGKCISGSPAVTLLTRSVVLGLGRCRRPGRTGRGPYLGAHAAEVVLGRGD